MWLGLLGYFLGLGMVVVALAVIWYIIGALFWVIRRVSGRPDSPLVWEVYLLHFVRAYLGSALIAYCTMRVVAHGEVPSWLLTTIGGFLLWVWIAGEYSDAERWIAEARQNMDFEALNLALAFRKLGNVMILLVLLSYIVMLYLPFLADNPVTIAILIAADWAQNLRFIGWAIAGWGVWTILKYIGIMGFGVFMLPIGTIIGLVELLRNRREERFGREYGAYVQEVLARPSEMTEEERENLEQWIGELSHTPPNENDADEPGSSDCDSEQLKFQKEDEEAADQLNLLLEEMRTARDGGEGDNLST